MLLRLFFLCLLSCSLSAKIVETNKMEDLLGFVDERTWVLFDLDDTLVEGENQLGRAKWFFHEIQKLTQQGLSNYEAQKQFYPEWILSQILCPTRTPEPGLSAIVAKVQQIALRVMGLTARHPPIASVTIEQLQRLGFDFSRTAPPFPETAPPTTHPTLFKGGVWFLSDFNKKGQSFVHFLDTSGAAPERVILVDDGRHHLQEMEKALAKKSIPFIGIHYTRAIERPFDGQIADLQYRHLPEILTDGQAAEKLGRNDAQKGDSHH